MKRVSYPIQSNISDATFWRFGFAALPYVLRSTSGHLCDSYAYCFTAVLSEGFLRAGCCCYGPSNSTKVLNKPEINWSDELSRSDYIQNSENRTTRLEPVCLRDLLHYRQPARTLRSSSQLLLYQPATRINFQGIQYHGTNIIVWNSPSPVAKWSATITTFKARLKTELFAAAYDTVNILTFLLPLAPLFRTLDILRRRLNVFF